MGSIRLNHTPATGVSITRLCNAEDLHEPVDIGRSTTVHNVAIERVHRSSPQDCGESAHQNVFDFVVLEFPHDGKELGHVGSRSTHCRASSIAFTWFWS